LRPKGQHCKRQECWRIEQETSTWRALLTLGLVVPFTVTERFYPGHAGPTIQYRTNASSRQTEPLLLFAAARHLMSLEIAARLPSCLRLTPTRSFAADPPLRS